MVRRPGDVPRYIWERVYWHLRNNPVKQWVRFKLMSLQRFRPANPVLQLIVPKNRWPDFWYTAQRMVARYVARPYIGPMVAVFTNCDERYDGSRELLEPEAEVRLVSCEHGVLFNESYLSDWLKPL